MAAVIECNGGECGDNWLVAGPTRRH